MKKTCWLLTVITITALFFQCHKELNPVNEPDPDSPVITNPVKANVHGGITDENNQPAAGVVVSVGDSTSLTDSKGAFQFTNIVLDKNATLVTASKDGYFKSYRVFAAMAGQNEVTIKLIRKSLAGTVAAASGGEVILSNGAKVSLSANSILTVSSNKVYSGDVKVYASYIDPKSADISKTMPGSTAAIDKNRKQTTLSSYGMIIVELLSASGDKLQIKSSNIATLSIPISSAFIASAPATIPLWYMDETTGIWQEEGTATKQGNNYVGDVKHFSYWSAAYPQDTVNLSFTLQTTSGTPITNELVKITSTSVSDTGIHTTGFSRSDSLGQVNSAVPANAHLVLEVYNQCYTSVYTQDISPLTQSKDAGIIKMTDSAASIVTIRGILLDCNNKPLTGGYIHISCVGYIRYIKADPVTGQFMTTYSTCSVTPDRAVITGMDTVNHQQSETITQNITLPVTDLGTIKACGIPSDQYVNYTVDGASYSIVGTGENNVYGTTMDPYGTVIRGVGTHELTFNSDGALSAGTFHFINFNLTQYPDMSLDSSASTVTFTTFSNSAGDFYEGSMHVKFITDSIVEHQLTGIFKVKRLY